MIPLLILGALAVLLLGAGKAAASTPAAPPGAPPKHDCSDIRWVQSLLNLLGYSAGPVDGISGPLTQAAAQKFGAEHGVAPGPNADDLFCEALTKAVAAQGR